MEGIGFGLCAFRGGLGFLFIFEVVREVFVWIERVIWSWEFGFIVSLFCRVNFGVVYCSVRGFVFLFEGVRWVGFE